VLGVLFAVFAAKNKLWSVAFLFYPVAIGIYTAVINIHEGDFFLGPWICVIACCVGSMAVLDGKPLNRWGELPDQVETVHRQRHAVFLVIGSLLLWCSIFYYWGIFFSDFPGNPMDIESTIFVSEWNFLMALYGLRLYKTGKGRSVVYWMNGIIISLTIVIGVWLCVVALSSQEDKIVGIGVLCIFVAMALIPAMCIFGATGILTAEGIRREAEKVRHKAKDVAWQGPRCVACNAPIESGVRSCPKCSWTQPLQRR
jgi:hypothetical protein